MIRKYFIPEYRLSVQPLGANLPRLALLAQYHLQMPSFPTLQCNSSSVNKRNISGLGLAILNLGQRMPLPAIRWMLPTPYSIQKSKKLVKSYRIYLSLRFVRLFRRSFRRFFHLFLFSSRCGNCVGCLFLALRMLIHLLAHVSVCPPETSRHDSL